MYPSKHNAKAEAFDEDSETSKLAARSSASNEKHESQADPRDQMPNPSAPLLPPDQAEPDMDPPSYSSVVAQDSSNWQNRSSSFSGGSRNAQLCPPASPHVNAAKSTSDLDKRTPYPTAGPMNQPPYPAVVGSSSHGSLHAPYPTGSGSNPEFASTAPYPAGPGPASGKAPYPMGSTPMPMPGPGNANRPIGFALPITTEPKSGSSLDVSGNRQGENRQYVPNQYAQQQPNVVYVVQKAPQQNQQADNCELCQCCLACCLCICECINLCRSSDS